MNFVYQWYWILGSYVWDTLTWPSICKLLPPTKTGLTRGVGSEKRPQHSINSQTSCLQKEVIFFKTEYIVITTFIQQYLRYVWVFFFHCNSFFPFLSCIADQRIKMGLSLVLMDVFRTCSLVLRCSAYDKHVTMPYFQYIYRFSVQLCQNAV